MKKDLVVTGGGTGGHLFAGIAIADEWKKRDPEAHILFVGARGGIEERLVPRAGYPLETLVLGSLKRVSIGRRLKTLIQIPLALLRAAVVLIRERPGAVIGVGGYASGPVVLMARLLGWTWGARVAIVEQNAVPGFTNRILGFFSQTVFCAFPGVEKQFGLKGRISGNPIRKEMIATDAAPRAPFRIFVFGGSQGALGINSLLLDAVPLLGDLKNRIEILHQTGEKDFDRVVEGYRKAGMPAQVEKFVYEMKAAYDRSSLLICRAGASTLSEIAAVGRASILIPLPTAADNHQEKNARLFTDAGAAVLLRQNQDKAADLARVLRDLIENPGKIAEMEAKARTLHREGAADRIVSALKDPA